jgi:hypothetical protein
VAFICVYLVLLFRGKFLGCAFAFCSLLAQCYWLHSAAGAAGVRCPSGTCNPFFFLLEISFRQLRVCNILAPSLTRGRVCKLLYNCFWALPEQSLLGRSPAELTTIFYCPIWDSPNLEGQVLVFRSHVSAVRNFQCCFPLKVYILSCLVLLKRRWGYALGKVGVMLIELGEELFKIQQFLNVPKYAHIATSRKIIRFDSLLSHWILQFTQSFQPRYDPGVERLRSRNPRIRPWDPLRWPRYILYLQRLVLTSPQSNGRSVGIVRSRTKFTGFIFV